MSDLESRLDLARVYLRALREVSNRSVQSLPQRFVVDLEGNYVPTPPDTPELRYYNEASGLFTTALRCLADLDDPKAIARATHYLNKIREVVMRAPIPVPPVLPKEPTHEGHSDLHASLAAMLDAVELRGHQRAVSETAIASVHKAVAAERAAAVAYPRGPAINALNILDVADEIERGDHHADPKEPTDAR